MLIWCSIKPLVYAQNEETEEMSENMDGVKKLIIDIQSGEVAYEYTI